MTLQEIVASLPEQQKIALAAEFVEIALPIWENYAFKPETDLSYLAQPFYDIMEVDEHIVANALQIAKDYLKPHAAEDAAQISARGKKIISDYLNHNSGISHQELDLEYNAQLVFYSGFNLLCHIFDKKDYLKEEEAYVSANQSIDAITRTNLRSWDEVRAILATYPK